MEGENEVRKLEREKGTYIFLFTEAALQNQFDSSQSNFFAAYFQNKFS